MGEQRSGGDKGVISGVHLGVPLKELMANLSKENKSVKGVIRMTRGAEKTEMETILIEFDKEIPREVSIYPSGA